ncbi:MAG TPA: GNAT family N-acetyltransferase [Actinophytocola sp.]|nr:GNAT family N-acetyltransferase [Actinophytocola sp.]
MHPRVRAFADDDLDAVVALSLRAWAPVFASLEHVLGPSGVFARMHPDWRVDQERAVREACHTDGMRVWVAEVDAAVVGFAAARLDQDERMGEVYMIAVDPDQQRTGVGALLMSAAMDWFRDNGMAMAMVETGGDEGHEPARRMYERAGFTPLPTVRFFQNL